MQRPRQFALALGASLLFAATSAEAQRRSVTVISTSAGGTTSAQVVRPAAAGSGSLVTSPIVDLNGVRIHPGEILSGSISSVPAAGFDFTHHAAVRGNLGVRALIDPVTQHQLALARQIRRETPAVAFPIAFPVLVNNIQVNVAPSPVVVVQADNGGDGLSQRVGRLEYASLRGGAPAGDAAPAAPVELGPSVPPSRPPELADYVFLRRDGGLIFAVAYTVARERIVYVTREGLRRSVTLTDLDLETTLQMNEQRGTSFRLPGL